MITRLFDWLEGTVDPFPKELPDKPPATLLGFVLYYSWPFRFLLAAAAAVAIVVALLEIWLFSLVGKLVDWLGNSTPETFWAEYQLQLYAIGALVLIVLPALKLFYESIHLQGLMGNFPMRTRWQAHRYLLRQSVSFYQNDFAGRVATKMMQTALGVRDAVIKATEVLLYVGVYFTGAVILFGSSDLRFTIPMLIWLTGYVICMYYFVPKLRDVSKDQAEARSLVTGRVVDSYTNIATVKMFAHADDEDRYAHESMDEFIKTVYLQMRLSTWLTMALNCLNAFLLFSVAATGIWLWQQGAVTTGAIAFATGLVLRMQGMSQWILWEVSSLFENIGVIQDGIDTIARDREVLDAKDAMPLKVSRGAICYKDIHFNYGKIRDDEASGIIDGLTLNIQAGEKVGIVGRSGAGKSTLTNLLLRFYDIESGEILIDDQAIANVTQESLRANIGMVTQDTSLLHRSVLENIRYGTPDASFESVLIAARRAHAHDFIQELEDLGGRHGYDAHVGERGVKLSGGQRQRVAIARVLLKDAPILVLDEATSALDSEVEAAIQESLYSLMENKTVIAIAHRLSTIAAMDRLIVMDKGEVVEQGNHQELLQTDGIYAQLWSRQSGGFLAS
ncbi:MAG: ATP-binding cassette subfamily B multidrug efflux pump [Parasphingorhabdus sp.]